MKIDLEIGRLVMLWMEHFYRIYSENQLPVLCIQYFHQCVLNFSYLLHRFVIICHQFSLCSEQYLNMAQIIKTSAPTCLYIIL